MLPGAWEEQWQSAALGINTMYDIPDDVNVYYGMNFTFNTGFKMREVMEFRNRAKVIRAGVGSANSIIMFEVVMSLLSLGYEARQSWNDEYMVTYLEKLCSQSLVRRFQAFEAELDKRYSIKEVQWPERFGWLVCGNLLSVFFAIALTTSLSIKTIQVADFDFVLANEMTIWGGKMLHTMTYDGAIFVINIALNLVIPGCCWGLYFEGCYRPAYLLQRRNEMRAKHINRLFISKPGVDDYEALIEEDEVDSSGKLVRHSVLSSLEELNDAVQYRDFMWSFIQRDHQNTEGPIFGMLLANVALFTNVALNYIIFGTFGSGYWGPWALVACPIFTFGILRILLMALQVKTELTKVSLTLLQEVEYEILNPLGEIGDEKSKRSAVLDAAKVSAERMSLHTADLTLLGISINLTFIRTVFAYFVSLLVGALVSSGQAGN